MEYLCGFREITEQDVYQALDELDDFTLTKISERTEVMEITGKREDFKSETTYKINGYNSSDFTADVEMEWKNITYNESDKSSFLYEDEILHNFGDDSFQSVSSEEFLDLRMPEKECINNVLITENDTNVIFTFDINEEAVNKQNAHILQDVTESGIGGIHKIYWAEGEEDEFASVAGYDQAVIQVVVGIDGKLRSLHIDYQVNIITGAMQKVKGTTEFIFE